MKRFLIKVLLFFLPPLLLGGGTCYLYYRQDVYADFSNKNLNWRYFFQQLGDLSTKKLHSSPVKYNSFIFGSSRSCGVYACYLQKHIPGSAFFHYANWNETIGGIAAKLRSVDSLGYPIKNAVIYLDATGSFEGEGGVNGSDHYILTGEKHPAYLVKHFKSFFSNMDFNKLRILFGLPVRGQIFPDDTLDPVKNDYNHLCSETVIKNYSEFNNEKTSRQIVDSLIRSGYMYSRPIEQQYCREQIGENEKNYLQTISAILNRHHSRFWVIITPLYDQKKLNPVDSQLLCQFFPNNVYDFSGINSITNDIYNFPDRRHFHSFISKNILDSVVLKHEDPMLLAKRGKK